MDEHQGGVTMLTKENQGKKNEGHLVVRLPVVMRLAECSIRFLMAAVLAGAEMFGGFAMCGVAMVGASGPGTEGFAALLGACFGYLCFRGFVEGLRYVAASVLVFAVGFAGLPLYSLEQMIEDVRVLAGFGTGEIQLELLKLLPGTAMRAEAEALGIVYSPDVPYEVLQTKAMSMADLRQARLLSRLIDGFYNALAWQEVTRKLIGHDECFLSDFLRWMEERELLEQPLSLERRGALLYEFCEERYPMFLTDISVAWIVAGIPFAKEPSKRLKPWSKEVPGDVVNVMGEYESVMRVYHLPGEKEEFWFGFDRGKSASRPLYVGKKLRGF